MSFLDCRTPLIRKGVQCPFVQPGERVAAQGAADLATNIASGSGALISGIVLSMSGFHTLSIIGTCAAGALMIHASYERRLGMGRGAV